MKIHSIIKKIQINTIIKNKVRNKYKKNNYNNKINTSKDKDNSINNNPFEHLLEKNKTMRIIPVGVQNERRKFICKIKSDKTKPIISLRKKNLKKNLKFFYVNNNQTLNKETNPINYSKLKKLKNFKVDFQKKLKNNCIKKTYNSYNNIHFYNDNKANKIISTNKNSEIIKLYKNVNIVNKNNNFINKYNNNDKQKDITKNLIIINNYYTNDKSLRLIKNTTINNLINNLNKDIKIIKSKNRYINNNHLKINRLTKNFNLDKSIIKLNNNKISKNSIKNIGLYLNTLNNSYELNNSKVINKFNNKSLNSNNM
jgi:hypothetical protein